MFRKVKKNDPCRPFLGKTSGSLSNGDSADIISHLAYAPEIANAMLQRQQASAIIAARKLIVEGAVVLIVSAEMMK